MRQVDPLILLCAQRIPDLQSRKTNETGIVGPDLCYSGIEGGKADLQVEDARPADPELFRDLQAPRHECGGRGKNGRSCRLDQRFDEPAGRCGT